MGKLRKRGIQALPGFFRGLISIVCMVVFFPLYIYRAFRGPPRCQLCHCLIKRDSYTWSDLEVKLRVCPNCDQNLAMKKSEAAVNNKPFYLPHPETTSDSGDPGGFRLIPLLFLLVFFVGLTGKLFGPQKIEPSPAPGTIAGGHVLLKPAGSANPDFLEIAEFQKEFFRLPGRIRLRCRLEAVNESPAAVYLKLADLDEKFTVTLSAQARPILGAIKSNTGKELILIGIIDRSAESGRLAFFVQGLGKI